MEGEKLTEKRGVDLSNGNKFCLEYPPISEWTPEKMCWDDSGIGGSVKLEYRCHLEPYHKGPHEDLHKNRWIDGTLAKIVK